MKSVFVVLAIAAAVAIVNGQAIPRSCPIGEHMVMYCPLKAEPTCDNPTVHDLPKDDPLAGLCNIPQCFCNRPTVRNTRTRECIFLGDCKK